MDSLALVIVLVVLVWASFNVVVRSGRRKLPPGPYPFPIIGNIFQLGSNPHRSLANLSKTYGPLMSLHLGSLYTVVASSPEVAKQVLHQHDQALSNRTIIAAAEALDFHKSSFGFSTVGSSIFKRARKICREHLFSTARLDESQGLRLEKLTKLRDYLHECAVAGRAVNVGEAVFTTAVNLMTATLFSLELATFDSDTVQELKETVEGVMKTMGTPNLADYFPLLKPFDPQGIKKQSEFYLGKMKAIVGDIIKQRVESRGGTSKIYVDLLETLLNLREETDANLSINNITHLFMELFMGQTHTTTSTVEWAITELILNPATMANAKNELRSVIGKTEQVAESDISRLPYMQAVIKETLRLHSATPLLVPHKAESEVEINGYTIPKNTQIFVNVWAMGRDSSIWRNPTSFEPERFFNSEIDYKGQYFELLPFGSGRRICPGMPLADRMLPLMVASLIHNFDWKLEAGVKPEDVDTTDKFGIALRKAVPLMAIPFPIKV
ncbi:hypothetical protein ACS0TY_026657 [Phlomoides rotata]